MTQDQEARSQNETRNTYIFRIGDNPVGRAIQAASEADAWKKINQTCANRWVELEAVV